MNIISLISNPNGRINRLQFLGGNLTTLLIGIFLYIIPMVILLFMYSSVTMVDNPSETESMLQLSRYNSWVALLCFIPGTIFLIYSLLCLALKRLQDTGYSPWLLILIVVPWVNALLLLFLMLFPTRDHR